jgi:hypothetical protein
MMTIWKKLERWRCWKIENLEPCDCKTPANCLMYNFVAQCRLAEMFTN